MNKIDFKNYMIYFGTFVIFLVIILLGVFVLNKKSYNSSALSVNYLDDISSVTISNELPMTDVVGKTISLNNYKKNITGYVEFEVKSTIKDKVKYEIYLVKDKKELEVPDKFVKVYLTDNKDKPLKYFNESQVPTFYELRLASKSASGKLIYIGSIKGNETQSFKLRMWVADTYELTTDPIDFTVKLEVVIK